MHWQWFERTVPHSELQHAQPWWRRCSGLSTSYGVALIRMLEGACGGLSAWFAVEGLTVARPRRRRRRRPESRTSGRRRAPRRATRATTGYARGWRRLVAYGYIEDMTSWLTGESVAGASQVMKLVILGPFKHPDRQPRARPDASATVSRALARSGVITIRVCAASATGHNRFGTSLSTPGSLQCRDE
jgi:hypothetical protein